jgi:hypothetical protein
VASKDRRLVDSGKSLATASRKALTTAHARHRRENHSTEKLSHNQQSAARFADVGG